MLVAEAKVEVILCFFFVMLSGIDCLWRGSIYPAFKCRLSDLQCTNFSILVIYLRLLKSYSVVGTVGSAASSLRCGAVRSYKRRSARGVSRESGDGKPYLHRPIQCSNRRHQIVHHPKRSTQL